MCQKGGFDPYPLTVSQCVHLLYTPTGEELQLAQIAAFLRNDGDVKKFVIKYNAWNERQ